MNREQKAAVIEEIAAQINESEAVYAVDYRGITVAQAAELRGKLREADATLRIVKNTLTDRAADRAGAPGLKALLEGPTALTFARGDAASAAKAVFDYARATGLLPFKGGVLNGEALAPEQVQSIARLPTRDVLNAQFVNIVASPLTGLVTSLSNLISGLARQLSQVAEKKESGELPAGDPPAGAAAGAAESAPETAAEPDAAAEPAPEAGAGVAAEPEAPADEPTAEPEAAAPEAPAEADAAADDTPSDPAQEKE
ncbi:MAG: large subunit ribosomal protein [Solirubrobacteraceae bacterium]|jgi:large subunit ribosomal protein L10|nr:large subunit ribosomal protein [Solirubrobacteraceae bacterium]